MSPKKKGALATDKKLTKAVYQLFDITKKQKNFLGIIALLILIAGIVTPYPHIAMWFGFALAGYSAIANDSIQTIGTFIASNSKRPWWLLWGFMGAIFLATVTYSWVVYNGDVSYQRLATKGFAKAPESFHFLQLVAPIVLLFMTRMRMPVSTTFLLLSSFTTQTVAIVNVLQKSLMGYVIAFIVAIIIWFIVNKYAQKYFSKKRKKIPIGWVIIQWVTSGSLWAFWLMQDAANIAVFLPRSMDTWQFLGFAGYIFFGLGLLFYLKGDKIQGIVNEKTAIIDIRAATLVDFVYAILLYLFKIKSDIPMSTTWVFIGLLGGREIAFSLSRKMAEKRIKKYWKAIGLVKRDLVNALIGLIVSLIMAVLVNAKMRDEIMNWIMGN